MINEKLCECGKRIPECQEMCRECSIKEYGGLMPGEKAKISLKQKEI
jgi:hypothetical protein